MPPELSDTICTFTFPSAASACAIVEVLSPSPAPTSATIPRFRSTDTSPSDVSPPNKASRCVASSMVMETETSDVATTSTDVRCSSKISKMRRRNPCASSMRGERDARPASLGPVRIVDKDRNPDANRRGDRARVQHLRAERGELGRFVEAYLLDQAGVGHHPRVGGQHAVDVRPDLDGLGAKGGAEQCRAVVAST